MNQHDEHFKQFPLPTEQPPELTEQQRATLDYKAAVQTNPGDHYTRSPAGVSGKSLTSDAHLERVRRQFETDTDV
jgi:hypothetical protein